MTVQFTAIAGSTVETPHSSGGAALADAQSLLGGPDERFHGLYNRTSFQFEHLLAGNPLFELPALIAYAKRMETRPEIVYWSNGAVKVGDGWSGPEGHRLSLLDTISGMASNDSQILFKRMELDPEYGPLIRGVISKLLEIVGPQLSHDVIIGRGTLLIASPRRITTYHIDSDTNFLFQVRGDKTISVFNHADRTLIAHNELEQYYSGNINGAAFKQARQRDGHAYDLRAGTGVHIPCMAPHWAQNGGDMSVALSVNFDLKSIARLARIYRFNHRLRRFGLAPAPPGISHWRDQLKLAVAEGLAAPRRVLRRRH
jgi:hypothetical protein